ncbi:hypothetical protein [Streptomyces lavendulocolor]|uniref:hypothetical protein n=1 Tax=Streptomyces lavendulocolor TaxID=67316 RepID=UPI0033F023C7
MAASVVVSALIGGLLFPATTAHASSGEISCISSTHVSYHPGLRVTPQTVLVEVDGSLEPCTGLSGQGITAGAYGARFTAIRSCADLTQTSQGQYTISWDGGTNGYSTISFQRVANVVGGNIVTTETGTVIDGDFYGGETLFVTAGAHNPLDCLIPNGVQDVYTDGTLTITAP